MSGMRENGKSAARRAYLGISRGIITKSDDSKRMQEVGVEGFKGEAHSDVEHWHPFGFSSRPKAPDGGKHAEALIAYIGGSRSHPVVIATADRRHRPKNLREGEACLHDSSGQEVRLTEDGIVVSSAKKITMKVGDNVVVVTPEKVFLGSESATKRIKLEDNSASTKVYSV